MDIKKMFSILLVLAVMFAPVGFAATGDTNFTNVVASGDVTAGDDVIAGDAVTATGAVSGATVTGTTSVTSASVIATQYVRAQYFSNATRPASGAPVGSIIVLGTGGAGTNNCGTATAGTTLRVCVSDGTNWIAV